MHRFLIFIWSLCVIALLSSCAPVSTYARDRYAKGTAAWDRGEVQQAISFLMEAVDDSPDYYDAYLRLAEYHFVAKDYPQVIYFAEQAIKVDKKMNEGTRAEGFLILGEVYIEQGQYAKAQYQFSQAIKLPSLDKDAEFRAYRGKGICKLEQTLVNDAQQYLEKALLIREDDPTTLFYDALLKEKQMGPNLQSIKTYELVLKSVSDDMLSLKRRTLKQIGDTWKTLQLTQKAVDYYQQFIASGGTSAEVSNYIAAATASQEPQWTPQAQQEVILVCPECGRLGKKGQTSCDFDGATLVEQ